MQEATKKVKRSRNNIAAKTQEGKKKMIGASGYERETMVDVRVGKPRDKKRQGGGEVG